jgi:hypothetical protein
VKKRYDTPQKVLDLIGAALPGLFTEAYGRELTSAADFVAAGIGRDRLGCSPGRLPGRGVAAAVFEVRQRVGRYDPVSGRGSKPGHSLPN